MKKTILAILAITSLLLLHAQENAAPQAEQQEQPAVTSQKRLRELTLAELDQKNHRAREAGEIAAKFKNISTIQNVDLRITEYLRLQKRMERSSCCRSFRLSCQELNEQTRPRIHPC